MSPQSFAGQVTRAALAFLPLVGCASFEAIPVAPNDYVTPGIRIPERKPIVIVAGGKVSVSFVCNYNRETAIRFGNYLAKQHIIMSFESCGALNTLDSDTDATAVPVALINTVGQLAKSFAPGTGTSGTLDPSNISVFQIFDVRFDGLGDISLVPLIKKKDLLNVRFSSNAANLSANWVPQQGASASAATKQAETAAQGGVAGQQNQNKKDVKAIEGFGR